MNVDGSGLTRVAANAVNNKGPSWSPDSAKIAFESYNVIDADGSGLTRLTDTQLTAFGPTWSPDGTKIAFTSAVNYSWDICVIDADGKQQTNITNYTPGDDAGYVKSWSSDGSKIVYTSSTDYYQNNAIWIINADGTGKTKLTDYNVMMLTSSGQSPT
jgi:Tol biopolymer transport system component